ncbi:hypothetical protein TRICI_003583 [Trichomonascus ciferrii]|uniref:Arrestin-like N-terminal domain-containing protein n=1 Tax=Trichomonascus ciferrii TaxID=44093 RepID=A0A642V2V4_9ASCO|nr:hypothetical protein TRICI_003583 [Trichomonascus ciferrii]
MVTPFEQPPPYEDNSPPGYESTQFSVRVNDNPDEEVQFMLSEGPETYTLGDLILGKLVVCPVNDTAVSSIHVSFNLIESYTALSNRISPRTSRKISITENIVPVDALEERTLKAGFEYSFPFSILVPYTLPMGTCQKTNHPDTHSMLPPIVDTSLEVAYQGGAPSNIMAKLSYGLTAVIRRGERSLKQHFKHIKLVPNYPIEEYLGSYRRTCCSRMNIKRDPFHMLGEISAQSNSPVVIGLADDDHVKDLVLHLRFLPNRTADPPAVRRISYKAICSLTITPPSCTPFQPLIEDLSVHNFDINDVKWTYQESAYHSNVRIPISLDKQMLSPSFATCLVSREYYIVVEIHVGQKTSSTRNVRLCIPLLLIPNKPESLPNMVSPYERELNFHTQKYCTIV